MKVTWLLVSPAAVLIAVLSGSIGLASGQVAAPAVVQAVDVTPGHVPVFRLGDLVPIEPPPHPPLDQIPPMPMPFPTEEPNPAIRPMSMVVYDSTTGESYEIPLAQEGDLPPDMRVTRAFGGIDPNSAPGREMSRGLGTMAAVTNAELQAFPARPNCKLAMRYNVGGTNYWFSCSGTLIDGGVVLTAGHCVYTHTANVGNPPAPLVFNRWAEEIYVYPGWNGAAEAPPSNTVSQYWGWARSTNYQSNTAWVDNVDFNADLAVIRLNRTSTRNIGMLTGWYGMSYDGCDGSTFYNWSYPAETCNPPTNTMHTGRQMYYWAGTVNECPNLVNGNQYIIHTAAGCLTAVWGGMSGSSMYKFVDGSRTVMAVCSRSNRSTRGYYCGLTDWFFTQSNTWISDTRGTVFDAEVLRCRITGATTFPAASEVTTANFVATNPTNNNPASRTYTFRVYLSTNNDISDADTLLSTQTFTYDFAPMSSITVNIAPFSVPGGTPAGNYWIGVILDNATDTNTDNNDTDTWDAQPIVLQACPLPAAPTSFTAQDGTACDRVPLLWNIAPGATGYEVWRSTTNNTATAAYVLQTSGTTANDTTAVSGQTYYYWVRSRNDCGLGPFSASDLGYRRTPLGPPWFFTTIPDCTSIGVTWLQYSGATSVEIYRGLTNNSAAATLRGTVAGTSTYFLDNTAAAGVTYWYFVRGNNDCGLGTFSQGVSGLRTTVPSAPTGIAASNGTTCAGVRILWTPPSNATSVQIFRHTSNNSAAATQIATVGAGTSPYMDTTAVLGTTYWYWLKAVNSCGAGGFSVGDAGYRSNPPGAPTGVSASDGAVCTPAITVIWNPVNEATSYEVWRHTSNNSGSATRIGTISAPPYTDSTAAPNLPYYYWIKTVSSCISGGVSGFSASDVGNRGTAAAAPSGVSATDGTRCQSVTVTWTPPAGSTGFQIFRNSTNNSATATLVGVVASPPYIDNNVVGTTVYWYFVKATNSCGVGAFSAGNSGFGGNTFAIDIHPVSQTVAAGDSVSFFANGGGATGFTWRKNGVALSNGGNISGARTRTLVINPASPGDEGTYTCAMISPCGNATSNGATLTVTGILCPADFNQDGGIDGADVDAFFAAWEAGSLTADVNQDGGVDGADVDTFFAAWEAGGCG